jgi:hypothetical protein
LRGPGLEGGLLRELDISVPGLLVNRSAHRYFWERQEGLVAKSIKHHPLPKTYQRQQKTYLKNT